jgi:hypothetical protein
VGLPARFGSASRTTGGRSAAAKRPGTCLFTTPANRDSLGMNRSLSYAHSSRDGAGGGNLVLRRGRPTDAAELTTLAELDSARPLTGERIVAEVDGRLVAAVSLHDGRVVADPFAPTADVVEMLRVHTAGGRSAAARPRRTLPRLVPRRVMPKVA